MRRNIKNNMSSNVLGLYKIPIPREIVNTGDYNSAEMILEKVKKNKNLQN